MSRTCRVEIRHPIVEVVAGELPLERTGRLQPAQDRPAGLEEVLGPGVPVEEGLLELAEERQSLGECPAFTFLEGDERRSLSYRELLQKAGVAATPGVDFDRTNGSRFVRFSYAGSRETIERALERTAGFLRRA